MKKFCSIISVLLVLLLNIISLPLSASAEECEHFYISQVTTEPTCTEYGVLTYACIYCDSTYEENVEYAGHNYISQITKQPTCTEPGERAYACINCSDHHFEVVEATGHSLVTTVTTKANCTTKGVKTISCSNCSYSYTQEVSINPSNHNYQAKYYPATCEARGYTKYICSRCNANYIDSKSYVDARGHNYTSTVTKKPTYTAAGVRTYSCKNCTSKYTKPIDKLILSIPTISSKASTKDSITLKWKKNSNATGYQIQYSIDSKFKSKKSVTIKKKETVAHTIKSLKSNKRYYVRIRAYRTEGKKTAYSNWKTFNITTKKVAKK